MSPQIVVDEHLDYWKVTRVIARWIKAEQIGYELGHKAMADENIRTFLHQLKQRTLITIDDHFYKRQYCDSRYCLIYFDVPLAQQNEIPDLFRKLFRIPLFRTSRLRMGKVVRVSRGGGIRFFDSRTGPEKHIAWTP